MDSVERSLVSKGTKITMCLRSNSSKKVRLPIAPFDNEDIELSDTKNEKHRFRILGRISLCNDIPALANYSTPIPIH